MSTKKTPTRARKLRKPLTAAEKAKAVPADQLTKAKAPTELEVAEKGVKKEKTTTIAAFRRALEIGRANEEKYATTGGKAKLSLILMDGKGNANKISQEYTIKLFTPGDWKKYQDMQKTLKSGKPVELMTRYAAAAIVGCIGEDGNRLFKISDAGHILDKPANAIEVMSAANTILLGAGATEDQDAVEKPD